MKTLLLLLAIYLSFVNPAENNISKDVFDAGNGTLSISIIGHGTLLFEYKNMVIHVDPTMREAGYNDTSMP